MFSTMTCGTIESQYYTAKQTPFLLRSLDIAKRHQGVLYHLIPLDCIAFHQGYACSTSTRQAPSM